MPVDYTFYGNGLACGQSHLGTRMDFPGNSHTGSDVGMRRTSEQNGGMTLLQEICA